MGWRRLGFAGSGAEQGGDGCLLTLLPTSGPFFGPRPLGPLALTSRQNYNDSLGLAMAPQVLGCNGRDRSFASWVVGSDPAHVRGMSTEQHASCSSGPSLPLPRGFIDNVKHFFTVKQDVFPRLFKIQA